jgi:hypothetical protein
MRLLFSGPLGFALYEQLFLKSARIWCCLFVKASRRLGVGALVRSRADAAYERSVLVVGLARNSIRARRCPDEFHFANQIAAPGLIDPRAEVAFHFFKLFLPGSAVGSNLEASSFASDRTRTRGKRPSDDGRPGTGEPSERRFRPLKSPDDSPEKFPCSLHDHRDSSIT